MTTRHAVDLALDLARMPALARTSATPPIPIDIVELMQIAARSPRACQDAAAATGEPVETVIEAARFYLQQQLFRPGADCYRILGVSQETPRATARTHMRWLLQWLHPDRNSGLEAVYAERVLKAWREVSQAGERADGAQDVRRSRASSARVLKSLRLPWIKQARKQPLFGLHALRTIMLWAVPASAVLIALVLWSATIYFGADQSAAVVSQP